MSQSWSAQKKLSKFVCTGILSQIERLAYPYVFGLRGLGTGANSLLLIAKPNHKLSLISELQQFRNNIDVLFLSVNNSGVTHSQNGSAFTPLSAMW
jgi:galactokinase/mevalonate kinase-like predicted kinase